MGRRRGSRFRKTADAQEQFEQIEKRQRQGRRKKARKTIDSIEKSRQRERNFLGRIRRPADLREEFGTG
jgi:hypothetical protein